MVVDIEITPRTKASIRWLLVTFIFLASTVGVAHAFTTDLTWIASGKPVQSSKLLDNLNDLQGQIVSLQAATGPRQIVTALASGNPSTTSPTYVTLGPTISFMASATGRYRIFMTLPWEATHDGGYLRINAMGTSPTVVAAGPNYIASPNANTDTVTSTVWAIYSLTKGTQYTFNVEGKVNNGASTLTLLMANAASESFVMVAEQLD